MKEHSRHLRNGQVMITVLGISILSVLAFLGVLAYSSVVEKEIALSNKIHAAHLLEDSTRMALALAAQSKNRNSLLNLIDSQFTNYESLIAGTTCADGNPCNVKVKSLEFYNSSNVLAAYRDSSGNYFLANATSISLTDIQNNPDLKFVRFILESNNNQGGFRSVGIQGFTVEIPTQAALNKWQQNSTSAAGNLICPVNTPIFVGTKLVKTNNTSEIRAECRSISTSGLPAKCFDATGAITSCNSSSAPLASKMSLSCKANMGGWLKNFNRNMTPTCERFSNTVSREDLLCPAGSIARSFKINQNFQPINTVCSPKSGLYESGGG